MDTVTGMRTLLGYKEGRWVEVTGCPGGVPSKVGPKTSMDFTVVEKGGGV